MLSDYTSYSNLDASTGEYQEEEGFYQEEEEENFDHYQGKLIFLKSAKPLWGKAPLILPFLPQAYTKLLPYKFYLLFFQELLL